MKTCALVAAADFNANHFTAWNTCNTFDVIIAVDAGFASLEAIGCTPDVVVGDFDSLGYVPNSCKTVAFPTKKDASDLACAFRTAQEASCERAVVYGALGGRLDHTVGNLQECASLSEAGIDVTIVGTDCAVQVVSGPRTLFLPAIKCGTVSVFSLSDCATEVCIEGLEYPLNHVELPNRTSWGLSNEYIGKPATISVEQGTLAVFLPHEALEL